MYSSILAFIIALASIQQAVTSAEWDYYSEGPAVWGDHYPVCAQKVQSPVLIKPSCAVHARAPAFKFSEVYQETVTLKLVNNGHSVTGTVEGDKSPFLTLTGGPLSGTFTFSSVHVHWGENYKSGSEHQVENETYAGELHFVHVNAANNQTAVLGVLIKATKVGAVSPAEKETGSSAQLENYLTEAGKLDEINKSATISLSLASLMKTDFKKYWHYTGSLTTPPCTEGVIWIVLQKSMVVADSYFLPLRNNVLMKNYRPVQLKGGRTIYRNFDEAPRSYASGGSCSCD